MRSVSVPASREYDIVIGSGALSELGDRLRSLTKAKTAVLVAGERVFPLYGQQVLRLLEQAGFHTASFVHPSGEGAKSLRVYGELLNFLSERQISRDDVLLSLGGGVTGDLAGFAAATYRRGMDFVQIPSSLLSMVDASVGGKTGVNLPAGKNLVGCFYQPKLVLCDCALLSTLPDEEYRSGCAEIIKTAMLHSPEFLASVRETPVSEQYERVIATCVSFKRDLVVEDEFDRGRRQLLNFGHSIGHAIEVCSDYSLRHGEAVAAGMAMITRAAAAKEICGRGCFAALLDTLRAYGLSASCDISREKLREAMTNDKKRSGDALRLVVPEDLGRFRIESVPLPELDDWLRLGGAL